MPPVVNTPEMRFQVDEARKFAAIEEVKLRLSGPGAPEGISVRRYRRGARDDRRWLGLLRASNTQDVLVARAESDNEEGLARLLQQIDRQLEASGLERGEQAGH